MSSRFWQRCVALSLAPMFAFACGDGGDGGPLRDGGLNKGDACAPTQGYDVPLTGVDKVDLLFVINNTSRMLEEQAKLGEQLPRFLEMLTSGRTENWQTFTPVKDLHVGVVTTDMGVSGRSTPLSPTCQGFGDDGKLLKAGQGCLAAAGYFNYVAPADESSVQQLAENLVCLTNVGSAGCSWEQPLEAMYKALAPSTVEFGAGTQGHGDGANQGFSRPEAVLVVVHLTDSDDCSVTEEGKVMFDEDSTAEGLRVPGTSQSLGLNLRCSYNNSADKRTSQAEDEGYLHPVERYFEDFKERVKPRNRDRIVFAAITGISEESTGRSYDDILASPRMGFAIDPNGLSVDPTNVATVARDACRRCATLNEHECLAEEETGATNPEILRAAKPAVRLVKVAKGFGQNSLVTSICHESYAPTIDKLTETIGLSLVGACLPRELEVEADGTVDCDLVEVLPAGQGSCEASRGRKLLEVREINGEQRTTCIINQVAVEDEELAANPRALSGVDPMIGWFYDTFTQGVITECPADRARRVFFTPTAEPGDGVLRIECPSRNGATCGH